MIFTAAAVEGLGSLYGGDPGQKENYEHEAAAKKRFCILPHENIALLAKAQRRLPARRKRSRLPRDRRSEGNLRRIEQLVGALAR